MKSSKTLSIAAGVCIFISGAFTGAVYALPITVVNGSFEDSPAYLAANSIGSAGSGFTTVYAGNSIGGWNVTGGSVDVIDGYWAAQDGSVSLDLSGNSPGTISQSIYVPFSGAVSVSFAMAGNPDDAFKTKQLQVSLISTDGKTFTFDASGASHGNMNWVIDTAVFSGIAQGSYTLQFQDIPAAGDNPESPYGAALDNVSASVTVPDGGLTVALLGGSMIGLVYLRRRLA